LNSVLAAPLFHGSVADIGSGAGLPGLVLAIARPDVHWTLVEPMERRVTWLNEQVAALGLDNVTVMRARAEDVGLEFDVVTARAVSALRTLVPITAPLAKDGGELIFLKGQNVDAEIDAAQKALKKHKVTDAAVETLGEGVLTETTRVFRARVRA
jgi:16S rRNA (guanine527-N7)-methyltransferase